MTLPRPWSRAIALSFGLALLAGAGTAAHAIDPYPGETREAVAARSALEQQRRLADGNAAAEALAGGFTGGDVSSGGILQFGLFGLVALALGALRFSRGIFRASRTLTKVTGSRDTGGSFEDRLAEKLRELEPQAAPAQPAQVPAPELPVRPASASPLPAPGPRTFGRRSA